jgi:2-amino-4-hydroxy-6-hydroxymethyldihydropteridine diphosphokinase
MSVTAYLGFGSNMGNKEAAFHAALKSLGEVPETEVTARSHRYETDPVGLIDGGSVFLNAAIAVRTRLSPADLLAAMRKVELQLGKSPTHRSDMSRPVDLDLLMYGDRIVRENGLEVPHPRMHGRAFVLVPLAEIASEAMHPIFKCTVDTLLKRLSTEELNSVRPADGPPKKT